MQKRRGLSPLFCLNAPKTSSYPYIYSMSNHGITNLKEPPKHLNEIIIEKIEKKAEKSRLTKLKIFLSISAISIISIIIVYQHLKEALAASGFYNYLSLILSDSRLILNIGFDFVSSLIESLPFIETIGFLSLFTILFISLNYVVKSVIKRKFIVLN